MVNRLGREGADGALVPRAFAAVTVNVYVTPGLAPAAEQVCTSSAVGATEQVRAPSVDVAVYAVMGDPPSASGEIQVIVAVEPFTEASTPVGEPGATITGDSNEANRGT